MIEIIQSKTFSKWLAKLVISKPRVIIRRVLRLKDDAGDIKSVGEGMSEMRIHCGPGYRVYFTRHGVMIVVLLCGGDKDSQAKISAGLNSLPDNGGSIMTEEFFPFDPVKALDSREAIEYFLADAFETVDAEFIAVALGIVARGEGLEKLSAQTGLSAETLSHALSETGNLTLKTMLAVMKAVGLGLSITSGECTAS